ncbi:MAG: HPP family protein [Pseudomonadota bacterium]
MSYFSKMKGDGKAPPRVNAVEIGLSWLGAFIGISVSGYISLNLLSGTDMILMIAPFGATAVLIFGAPKSPLAQPRNVLGGHVLSALIAVACCKAVPGHAWLASSLAVSLSIAAMHATRTLHPPAGATALFAVIGGEKIRSLGFFYAVMPVGVGIAILLIIAVLFNNIPRTRRYPEFWV